MEDLKIINHIDSVDLAEALSVGSNPLDYIEAHQGGVLEFCNPETGTSFLIRKNLVVQRGRSFALERVHGIAPPVNAGYINDLQRTILLFGVGTGGTPTDNPFAPIPPTPSDVALTNPVPFRVVDPTDLSTAIATVDVPSYPVYTTVNSKKNYNYKVFDQTQTQYVVNKVDNKIYRKIPLYISPSDCRGYKLNEIALFFCTGSYTNIEMYSRATFDSESMSQSTGKGLLVNYYTYA